MIETLAVIALLVALIGVTMAVSRRSTHNYWKFLAATEYAVAQGYTEATFKQPWYKARKSNQYYRQLIPGLEKSPFEDES